MIEALSSSKPTNFNFRIFMSFTPFLPFGIVAFLMFPLNDSFYEQTFYY